MVDMGSTACEGMYSKLIYNDSQFLEDAELCGPEVHTVSVPSLRAGSRQRGPGPYRLATGCLATLCAVLLISIIAMSTNYKNLYQGLRNEHQAPLSQNESGGQIQMQRQPTNVTTLIEALSKLQMEKEDLMKERDELLARLAKSELEPTSPPLPPSPLSPTSTPLPPSTPLTCPRDWLVFNSSCYYISTRSMSWPDSQAWCKEKGGHLAIIHTAEEQTFLWNQLPRGHWNAYWFGISDETAEADWLWVDGTKLVGGFWEEGEPNNHIDEDCGYIVKTRKLERKAVSSWYDAPCTMYWPFICEIEM
ncbi:C-type lectin domain family 4 member A-like isoform X2 [Coregonus clupeaformis]|uniref:C-type lectin domain-containing protein n=1 Tax=Coregonus suidteri TaxID=861788 RepID=A0AAN8R8Y5_9TELE|nr:C-type lectin domain family 4 member A-like isoform X2 [Coregonus clupeaformis]